MLSHIFEESLRQHLQSFFFITFSFFQECSLSNYYSGQLLLKRSDFFELFPKHRSKKDKRWLLIMIKKKRGQDWKQKASGADHTLNEVTSRLPGTRLILHCLPHAETLLLFTSPTAPANLRDSATDMTKLPSRCALSIIPDTETWTALLGKPGSPFPFVVCRCPANSR